MATTIKRTGFGQVEPNHLSAQRTSQIYAQLPAASSIEILENGQFVKYAAAKTDTEDKLGLGHKIVFHDDSSFYVLRFRFILRRKKPTPSRTLAISSPLLSSFRRRSS